MTSRRSISFAAGIAAISIALLAGGTALAQDEGTAAEKEEQAVRAVAQPKPVPAKVASVNGVAISGEELKREYGIYLQRTGQPGSAVPAAQQDQIRVQILEGLIDQELLYQESRKLGIQIQSKSVNDQLDAIKQRYPSEAEFTQALDSMQMTEVEVKKQIERGLAIKEVIDKAVASGIEVDEAESRTFYDNNPQFFTRPERVKASHILIKVDPAASEADKKAAREKIEGLRQQAKGGADFADLARTQSQGPSSTRGGDLGFFQRGQMVKPFEDAAFGMEKDQLSDIVETRFGYHLIKVTDKEPEKKFSYEEVKDRLTARLKQDKVEKEARTYIDTLKNDAKIEKFL
jgi:peptidyl-prolyl cis-trans isomerase C